MIFMKTNKRIFWSVLVLVFSMNMTSCEKTDNESDGSTYMTIHAVEDKALSDYYWNMIEKDVDIAGNILESGNYKSVTDSCPCIFVEFSTDSIFPLTIIIDYGNSYCEGINTFRKKGKIFIHMTKPILMPGSVRTITFEEFYIRDLHIEGTKMLTNKGMNDSGHLNFDAVLADGKITFGNGEYISREVNHNRAWVKGMSTFTYHEDDEWEVIGTANGISRKGTNYVNEIIIPILVKASCEYPVSGSIDITIQDMPEIVLDYGDGTCDDIATFTIGDATTEITLGRH